MPKRPAIVVRTGVPAHAQADSFQNATLTDVGPFAVSIAVTPAIPEDRAHTQRDIADHLREALAPLAERGWEVEVRIGRDD